MPYGKNDRWKTGFNKDQVDVSIREGNVTPTPNDGDISTFEVAQAATVATVVGVYYSGEFAGDPGNNVATTYIGVNPRDVTYYLEGLISIDIVGMIDQVAVRVTKNGVPLAGGHGQYTANLVEGTEYAITYALTGVALLLTNDVLALEIAADDAGTLILVDTLTKVAPLW